MLLSFENVARTFGKHDRCEWPKSLTVLDPLVQDILHFRIARVREQASITKRTRTEFRAALKPADHALVREQFSRVAADIVTASPRGLDANKKFLGRLLDVLIAVGF